jgi:hypothetical protein
LSHVYFFVQGICFHVFEFVFSEDENSIVQTDTTSLESTDLHNRFSQQTNTDTTTSHVSILKKSHVVKPVENDANTLTGQKSSISIYIRFVNETITEIEVNPTDTISNIKK